MKAKSIGIGSVCLATLLIFGNVLATGSKPTCDEKPTLRDCVKVEDPDAQPPKPSVYRNPKPGGPTAKPLPASGAAKAR